jgi:hypothetical protein
VLLVLENGCGVAVPALPDFIAALSFEGGQLVDVSYEPSENTWRWGEYAHAVNELRSLRATIAASAALGVFRLNEEGGLALARRMQYAKGVDPSLALYAAYVYDSLQRRDLIDEMRSYMEGDLGLVFFDVALLSRAPIMGRFVPPFPMLSRGGPFFPPTGRSCRHHFTESSNAGFPRSGRCSTGRVSPCFEKQFSQEE